MKALVDQNLSHRLVDLFQPRFPGSCHVRDHGLSADDDEKIWSLARHEGFFIVTKDNDFLARALVRGHPPQVVQVCVGNVSTGQIAAILRDRLGPDLVAGTFLDLAPRRRAELTPASVPEPATSTQTRPWPRRVLRVPYPYARLGLVHRAVQYGPPPAGTTICPPDATGPGTLRCPARLGISDPQANSINPRPRHADGAARSSPASRQRAKGRSSRQRGRSRARQTTRFQESRHHRRSG